MPDRVPEHKGLPILAFDGRAQWRAWLETHGETVPGIWLKLARKGSPGSHVTKADAIEEAIAAGWIDGQLAPWDERHWLVRFTPRGVRSKWSLVNRETADRLIAAGLMQSPGLRAVEAAKSDGRWEAAYAPQSRAEVPDDFATALRAAPAAETFFATLRGANRYAVLYRIADAKTAETRRTRIARFVAMLARGETVYPPSASRPAKRG